jgi:hypothetical protein
MQRSNAEATPQASEELRGSHISDEAFQELGCLFWEQAQITECCCGMEEIAMLLFYLPIIIFEAMFEAMFEANENKRKAGVSTVIE